MFAEKKVVQVFLFLLRYISVIFYFVIIVYPSKLIILNHVFDHSIYISSIFKLGHGADVKCLGWHPSKSIVASGSKDSQQPLKLWDPKSGTSLATM